MRVDGRVGTLRCLLRHLQQWRVLRESEGLDTIRCPDGSEWSLWDVEYLLEQTLPQLPARQRQSIVLCLIEGRREEDVAVLMQVSPTNPVSMYATDGIKTILSLIDAGRLPRFRGDRPFLTLVPELHVTVGQRYRLVLDEQNKWAMQAQDDEGWFDLYVKPTVEVA